MGNLVSREAVGLRKWFDHEASELKSHLARLGYETLDVAWSTNTMTRLAIPSLLQLEQVGEEGPLEYGNEGSIHRLIRGENFTADALKSAGFTYHHVESGWETGKCIDPDQCHEGPFLDEMFFKLYDNSILGSWLEESRGSYFREGAIHPSNRWRGCNLISEMETTISCSPTSLLLLRMTLMWSMKRAPW